MNHRQDDLHEIRKIVDMYFDHALTRDDEDALLQRVSSDPTYHRVFNSERMMREQIRQKIHRPGISPDLIQTIKDNIRMA